MPYNFICQLYLNKAEIKKKIKLLEEKRDPFGDEHNRPPSADPSLRVGTTVSIIPKSNPVAVSYRPSEGLCPSVFQWSGEVCLISRLCQVEVTNKSSCCIENLVQIKRRFAHYN